MEVITISYILKANESISFNKINFSDVTPEFKNISMESLSDENSYHITILKNINSTHPKDLEPIFVEATQEIERFKYVFSMAADIVIYDIDLAGYYYKNNFVSKNEISLPNMGINFNMKAKMEIAWTERSVDRVKNAMRGKYNIENLQAYYDSASIIEPIGRFISLYTLLLSRYGDSQKKVDMIILSVDPTIAQFRSPHSKNNYETVFTKLRNELSHKRKGINILQTRYDIKFNLERFQRIVKKLIIDNG